MFGGEWDQNKLKVLHTWGGKRQPGLYSLICQQHGLWPETPGDIPWFW